MLDAVCNDTPNPPRDSWPEVPANLELVCLRALAKEPEDRYPSAKALGREVKGWQESQRIRMQEAWRESEAFYFALVESLPQGILRKDVEGRFTYVNGGACRLLGLDPNEIIGKTDFDICPPELAKKYRDDDQFVLQTRRPLETTEEHKTFDGPERHVQIVKTPVFDDTGNPLGIQAIFWDVTEKHKLDRELREAQEEVLRLRDRLDNSRQRHE